MPAWKPEKARSPASGFEDGCFFSLAAFLASSPTRAVLHVAAVGENKATVLEGFRACPGTHVILLHAQRDASRARKLRNALCKGGVPTRIHRIPHDTYAGILREVTGILQEARLEYAEIHLNVTSGTPAARCALTTAAYLHGVKAFHLAGDTAVRLPILPYDQRDTLSPAKVAILLALASAPPGGRPLRVLASTGLETEEIDVHLRGEPGRKGLLALGLVEERGRFGFTRSLRLSGTGAALLESGLLAPYVPTV